MSCKAAIYTVNSNNGVVGVNGTIPLGTTLRRFGRNVQQNGNGISIYGDGYYSVNASFTVSATTAGVVTVQALKDGVAIAGATAGETAAAAGDLVNLSIGALIRMGCCDERSNITFVVSAGGGTIVNAGVVVSKI